MDETSTWSEVSTWLTTISVQASIGEPQWLAMDAATRLLFLGDAEMAIDDFGLDALATRLGKSGARFRITLHEIRPEARTGN